MAKKQKHGFFYYIFMFPFLFIKYIALFFLSVLGGVFYLLYKLLVGFFSIILNLTKSKQSIMTGIEYEHYVAKYLKSIGYRDVQITKASGDYGVDITAKKGTHSYAIQCKYYSNPVSIDAVQQVYSGMKYYQCDKAMVITNTSFTKSAVELAKSNGVKLLSNIRPIIFKKKKSVSHSSQNDNTITENLSIKEKPSAVVKNEANSVPSEEYDELFLQSIEIVVEAQYASTTLLQCKLKLGYARAARLIDSLEERGIVGPYEGKKPRKVLVSREQWIEMNALGNRN